MKIKSLVLALACATGLLSFTGNASALPLSETHTITASGAGSVGYTYFSVTGAGNFDLYTMGPTIDPVLILFRDDGSLDAADYLAADDDSCPFVQCGPAGSFSNSLINEIALATGNYILAVSDFAFSVTEAVSGLNSNNLTGDVAVVIAAGQTDQGTAAAVLGNHVPEPASLALLGIGLAGLGAMRRRKTT